MRFLKKDIIAIVVIIVFVIGINFITDKIMSDSVFEIISIANEIDIELETKINMEKVYLLYEQWDEKENALAFFSEHDELEKVTKEVKKLVVSSNNKLKYEIKDEIEQIRFLLGHIEEKNKLLLKNIF